MNKQYHDRDDFLLTDTWEGKIPSNAGKLWQIYFDNNKKRSNL